MLENAASDGVEDSVEELDRLGRGIAAGDLQRLVDHNGRGSVRVREHLRDFEQQPATRRG